MKYTRISLAFLSVLLLGAGCADKQVLDDVAPSQSAQQVLPEAAAVLTDQLVKPIGMSLDERRRVWVSQSGTGQNDGSVVVVRPNGEVRTVFTGFSSALQPNGELAGLGHVLYQYGTLYILDGLSGRLYIADVSDYKPSDAPQSASSLPYIDIKPFVLSQNLSDPLDSNIYDLAFGPDGQLYIADAGANAIIQLNLRTRALRVLARIPNISPQVQAVPTGIIYDGRDLLVSTLTGFPFASGAARILRVTPRGTVSTYRSGFTALTSLTLAEGNKLLVTEFGQFSFNPPTFVGWLPNSARVATDAGATVLAGQDRLTDIERVNPRTYYVLSTSQGTIRRLQY